MRSSGPVVVGNPVVKKSNGKVARMSMQDIHDAYEAKIEAFKKRKKQTYRRESSQAIY